MVALARSRRVLPQSAAILRRSRATCSPACARRRNDCCRNISTTAPARCCSSASPSCRNITRRASEMQILREHARDIAKLVPAGAALVEFGSGSSKKARIMLRALPQARRLCAGRYLRRDDRAGSARAAAGFPGAEGIAGDRRYHAKLRASGAGASRARARRIFSRLDHRQFRAARGGGVPAQCRPHPRERARR